MEVLLSNATLIISPERTTDPPPATHKTNMRIFLVLGVIQTDRQKKYKLLIMKMAQSDKYPGCKWKPFER